MKLPTLELAFAGELGQDAPVLRTAVQHMRLRRRQPGIDLRERLIKAAGRIEHLGVGDDRQKFVQATHWNAPGLAPFCQ